MTPEESYTFLIMALKGLGIFGLALIALVIVAVSRVPDFPDDDGESL